MGLVGLAFVTLWELLGLVCVAPLELAHAVLRTPLELASYLAQVPLVGSLVEPVERLGAAVQDRRPWGNHLGVLKPRTVHCTNSLGEP